jgi:hypothetical protein
MPENTERENLNHIRDLNTKNTNHLVRNDPELQGEVDIEVRINGRFDITVYKGDSNEPRKIENITKQKLMELIDDQL